MQPPMETYGLYNADTCGDTTKTATGNAIMPLPTVRVTQPHYQDFAIHAKKEIFITTFSPIVYKYNPEKDSFFPIANLGIDTALGKIIEDFRENISG